MKNFANNQLRPYSASGVAPYTTAVQPYGCSLRKLRSNRIRFRSGDPSASRSGAESIPASIPDGASETEKLRRVEAVLFLSREGITSRKMAKMAGLADATEARTLIRQLNQQYDDSGRAYAVEETAGGYTLLTRPQFAPWLRKQSHIPGELRLSQTALETLAVVAYRQPVPRANIEAIRGVGCSEILRQLMDMDLVRISGRSEELGRPYLYGTTSRFLQIFGLRSADRLPRIDWVNAPVASLDPQPAEDYDSERKESSMSVTSSTLLEEVHPENELLDPMSTPAIAAEDEDEFFEEYDDDDDIDDDDDDWDDDDDDDDSSDDLVDDTADADADDEEEDEDDEDDDEEDSGWEEVDDDDDGWEDDDDEEDDDDDDWDDDDDEEEWD